MSIGLPFAGTRWASWHPITYTITAGLFSNQGEKSITLYFIMVLLRKKYYSMVLQSPDGNGTDNRHKEP